MGKATQNPQNLVLNGPESPSNVDELNLQEGEFSFTCPGTRSTLNFYPQKRHPHTHPPILHPK